jgi:hypothetical protein
MTFKAEIHYRSVSLISSQCCLLFHPYSYIFTEINPYMKKKFLLILLPFLFFLDGYAQNEYYRKGYVITNTGDTLHGYIQRLADVLIEKEINFKTSLDENSDNTVFYPTSIQGFYLEDDKIKFEPVPLLLSDTSETEERFGILMLTGYCSLYKVELTEEEKKTIFENDNIYIAYKNGKWKQLNETETQDGSDYTLTKEYLDSLSSLFNDCNSINFETIKKINFNDGDLVNLFIKYNTCSGRNTPSVVYATQSPSQIKHGIEFSYPCYLGSGAPPTSGFSIGYFIDVLKPSLSERVSITANLNYAWIKYLATSSTTMSQNNNLIRFRLMSTLNLADKKMVIPFLRVGCLAIANLNVDPYLTVYFPGAVGCYIGKLMLEIQYNNFLFPLLGNPKQMDFEIGYRFK